MLAAPTPRIGALLLSGLLLVCVGLALVIDPGPFSIDEATYQHMVQSFVQGHGLSVWNGYEEYPSPELTSRWIREAGGHLYGQYPFLYVLLAAPFQAMLGFRGLFMLNALAFALSAWLCFRLSRQLLGSPSAAYLGAGLFTVASFAGNYALAAWPHALSVALVLGACSLAVDAWDGGYRLSSHALAAGACIGLGVGVRLDTALVAPALLAPFVLARPLRWRTLLGFGLGALGPLVASAVLNGLRWGDWSPVSYGRSVLRPSLGLLALPLALAGLGAFLRFRDHPGLVRQRWRLLGALALLLLGSLLVPRARELALASARGVWTLVIDLSALPLDRAEPGLSRGAGGGVVYFGTLKKALLQSCPYLALLLALLTRSPRSARERAAMWLLLAAPALVVLFYARTAWHGGLSFNLRYLCLALPFLAILCGHVLAQLGSGDGRAQAAIGGASFAFVLLCMLPLAPWQFLVDRAEFWLARGALALGACIGFGALAWALRPTRATARLCSALACAGAALAAVAGLAYDAPRAQGVRSVNYALGSFVAENVSDDSIVFVHYPDLFYSLIESRRRIRIAIPSIDRFRDMTGLADFHIAKGRAVFAVFESSLWQELDKTPAARRYELAPVAQIGPYVLRRMLPRVPAPLSAAPARASLQ